MAAPPFNTNLPRQNPTYSVPIIGGKTTAVSGLGTGSTQVIAANPDRKKITFHNPNATTNYNIAICQSTDANGNPLAAGIGVGGSFVIFPGASLVFDGACQMAFNAAASSAGAALTIIEE